MLLGLKPTVGRRVSEAQLTGSERHRRGDLRLSLHFLERRIHRPEEVRVGEADEQPTIPLPGGPLQAQPKIGAQLQRHIEPRQLAAAVELNARDVVDREPARHDQVEDLMAKHIARNRGWYSGSKGQLMKTERARSGSPRRREVMGILPHGDPRCPPNPCKRRMRRDRRPLNLNAIEDQFGRSSCLRAGDLRARGRLAHAANMLALTYRFNSSTAWLHDVDVQHDRQVH